MQVIKKSEEKKKISKTFRFRSDLLEKIERIARETGENKTYILESLLDYAIEAYEKQKGGKDLNRKKK
jgi:predicted transcriptional regulator